MSDEVFEQLKEIRDSGETNMLSTEGVRRCASQRHFQELLNAILDYGYSNVLTQFDIWLRRQETFI